MILSIFYVYFVQTPYILRMLAVVSLTLFLSVNQTTFNLFTSYYHQSIPFILLPTVTLRPV